MKLTSRNVTCAISIGSVLFFLPLIAWVLPPVQADAVLDVTNGVDLSLANEEITNRLSLTGFRLGIAVCIPYFVIAMITLVDMGRTEGNDV